MPPAMAPSAAPTWFIERSDAIAFMRSSSSASPQTSAPRGPPAVCEAASVTHATGRKVAAEWTKANASVPAACTSSRPANTSRGPSRSATWPTGVESSIPPMPQLSNHLRRLRDAGLVKVERRGRHAVYELADSSLAALMPLLDRLTGRIADEPARPIADFGRSRLCYYHLAGRLGFGVYRAL